MKLLWLLLGIVLVAAAAFFLWPTVQWYFLVPAPEKEAVLGSIQGLKAFVQMRSDHDLKLLLGTDPARPVPEQFRYLATEAATHLKKYAHKPVSSWSSADLLGEYPDRSLLSSTIERHNRTAIFDLKRRSHLVVGLGRARNRGIELRVRADVEGLTEEEKPGVLENVREILLIRMGSISSERPSVFSSGADEMVLRIPGAMDADLARSLVETRGRLSFQLVDKAGLAAVQAYMATGKRVIDEAGNATDTAAVPDFPKGSSVYGVYGLDEYGLEKIAGVAVVLDRPIVEGTAIKSALMKSDPVTRLPVVNFTLTPEGGEAFYRLTSANVGRPLAVVLDNRVRASATIEEPIRDQVAVRGFSAREAQSLALVLKTGSLPIRLEVISQHVLK
jgi:preprotein translocase subunit SecD